MEERLRRAGATGICVIAVLFFCLGSTPHLCWAEGAKTMNLDEALLLALKNQERIQVARVEVEKSRLLPKKAMTIMTPRITASGSYARLSDPIEFEAQVGNITLPPIQTVPKEQTTWNFEIAQPIYAGQFFPARKRAAQTIEFSLESYCQIVQDALFRVAQTYYEALKRERLVQNAKETLKLAEEAYRVSKVKFKAGDVTEDAVLRSELEISRVQSQIIKNVNNLKLANDFLKRLTGVVEREVRLVAPPNLEEASEIHDALLLKALDNRHDYSQASVAVKMAESDIELVKTRFHPRVGASWDYYKVSEPSFLQEDSYWVAAVKLEVPLFDGGLRYYDLREKRESLRQAKLLLEDSRQNIQIDLQGAHLAMKTEKALVHNSTNEVKLAEKNYEITFARYQYGAATFSDLTEALLYLDSARTSLIVSTIDHQVSIVNVQRASGQFARKYIEEGKAH